MTVETFARLSKRRRRQALAKLPYDEALALVRAFSASVLGEAQQLVQRAGALTKDDRGHGLPH